MSRSLIMRVAVLALSLLAAVSIPALGQPKAAGSVPRSWIADNGNGTYSNPLFYEEFEDPDVIRVGEDYYLAGTTMHMMPGVMIMHSRDLVNWELASYCIDKLDLGPDYRLENGRNIYGRGIWAPCIRYHDGMFYVLSNVNGGGLQVFRSKDPKGPWQHNVITPGYHDLSVLFDDDGKIYLVSGNHNPYPVVELNKELTAAIPGSQFQLNAPGMGEGHHLYKIKGQYYDVSAIPGGAVDQMVARADSIKGPWTVTRMVQGESMGVSSRAPLRGDGPDPNDRGLWIHQGGMCDTPSGDWWCVIMSDHGSIGRMVNLVPITWDQGFPLIGLPGNLRKAPGTWVKPNTGAKVEPKPAFLHDDDFDGPKLKASWQWNHVEDDSKWSLSEKPGVLRLHSLPASDFYGARNTLCQRPLGPECTCTVELDVANLATSDTAGLALLSAPYSWIGVVKTPGGLKLQMLDNTGNNSGRRGGMGFGIGNRGGRRGGFGAGNPAARRGGAAASAPAVQRLTVSPATPPSHLWLRVACNFDTDDAIFSWSADGKNFTKLGNPFTMTFQLTTFQGVRPGLFCYNTSGQPGGYADFDNFTMDAPRITGIEREIPLGKTIVLTSGADGSILAADPQQGTLVNIAANTSGAAPQNARFQVIDLGLGRVALKTAGGKVVSAGEGGVVLKDLAGSRPGDAESFQWVNLMRGDTMLMSLANHRYLATVPNKPGPVTVSAPGPRPDRKSGAEFKWQAVRQSSAPVATPGLKDAFAGKFLIGTATDLRSFRGTLSEEVLANIKANYNIITPENCMKPQNTHPAENTFNWTTADALVKWCGENNIKVWGHTLCWHQQTGNWFFQPETGATTVTREMVMARLKNHIQTVVGRYKGRVMGWDVVNEAINDFTTSGSESLRTRSWYQAVGPEVLTLAFKWAHEADPDALLFYNDYGIEQDALRNTGKHAASLLLLRRLIKEGAPIHGVGIQGHWSVNTNLENVEKAISDYEALGLKIAISELDVAVAGENSGQFPTQFNGAAFGGYRQGAPGASRGAARQGNLTTTRSAAMGGMRGMRGGRGPTVTASPEALKRQAEVYARLFQIFQRHSKSVMRVTFWGINDATSWKRRQLPLLFDGQMKPKPAYQAILDVAAGKSIAPQP